MRDDLCTMRSEHRRLFGMTPNPLKDFYNFIDVPLTHQSVLFLDLISSEVNYGELVCSKLDFWDYFSNEEAE
jgi:hypothetical protein